MRPDTVIVFTAYDDFVGLDSAESERNLMRAILRSAMDDIQKRGEPYRDARRYLMANESHYLYSFMSVCQHLELCPRTIRRVVGLNEEGAKSSMSLRAEAEHFGAAV